MRLWTKKKLGTTWSYAKPIEERRGLIRNKPGLLGKASAKGLKIILRRFFCFRSRRPTFGEKKENSNVAMEFEAKIANAYHIQQNK